MADWTPQSRAEEILFKTINGEPYDGLPQSRIEELLLELKDVIEEGGGGGGASIEHVTLSDTVIDSTGSHSLSGDYTEFDQIEVWLASPGYTSQECECVIIGVDTLKDMMDENRTYTISAFGTRFINLTFGSSAINISNMSDLNIIKIVGVLFGEGGSGTSDYNQLQNQPQINDITLSGDKTSADLGLVDEDDELTTAQMSALIALLD